MRLRRVRPGSAGVPPAVPNGERRGMMIMSPSPSQGGGRMARHGEYVAPPVMARGDEWRGMVIMLRPPVMARGDEWRGVVIMLRRPSWRGATNGAVW